VYLAGRLRELHRGTPLISDVRGMGLMLGVEMADHPAAAWTASTVASRVQRAALRRGLIVEIGGRADRVVRLLPPLNVSRSTVDDALVILADAVREVETGADR
jgi:diaminobutyrate-2-oxoglutarate transaminase